MLKRKITEKLLSWKRDNDASPTGMRKAFLLDGARQTGKTFAIRQFGASEYRSVIEINFLESSDAASLLGSCRNARETISALSLLSGKEVTSGKTLVFLDEVQAAPDMVTMTKSLVEDGRFDIALSGSMLGVELKNVSSFPVGYVRTERMHPLDFEEFCWSQGVTEDLFASMRSAFETNTPLEPSLHDRLVRLFRLFLVVGGMPEAVQRYLDTRYDLGAVRTIQSSITQQYRIDIAKYAQDRKLQVRSIFDAMPSELAKVNKRFELKSIRNKATFERYANDFAWLVGAGVALKCNVVGDPRYPLRQTEDGRKFKLYSSDTGLLLAQYPVGIAARALEGARDVNFGAVYENAVAHELSAAGVPLRYYYSSRNGEVDFLIEDNAGRVIPLEVKSGKDYKLHTALNNLLGDEQRGVEHAYVLSEHALSIRERKGKPVIYVPLYMASFIVERAAKSEPDERSSTFLSSLDATPPAF